MLFLLFTDLFPQVKPLLKIFVKKYTFLQKIRLVNDEGKYNRMN